MKWMLVDLIWTSRQHCGWFIVDNWWEGRARIAGLVQGWWCCDPGQRSSSTYTAINMPPPCWAASKPSQLQKQDYPYDHHPCYFYQTCSRFHPRAAHISLCTSFIWRSDTSQQSLRYLCATILSAHFGLNSAERPSGDVGLCCNLAFLSV